MESIADQLHALIKINRKIMNQLHKDETAPPLLRQRFDDRKKYTQKLTEATAKVDGEALTADEKAKLSSLFDRFEKQQQKIQKALDYILKESEERLSDAIKRNKADKSYQRLKR